MSKKAPKTQSFINTIINGPYKKGIVQINFTNESVKDDDFTEKYGVDVMVREYIIQDRDLAHSRQHFSNSIDDINNYAENLFTFGIKEIDNKIKELFNIKKSKIIYKLKKIK